MKVRAGAEIQGNYFAIDTCGMLHWTNEFKRMRCDADVPDDELFMWDYEEYIEMSEDHKIQKSVFRTNDRNFQKGMYLPKWWSYAL